MPKLPNGLVAPSTIMAAAAEATGASEEIQEALFGYKRVPAGFNEYIQKIQKQATTADSFGLELPDADTRDSAAKETTVANSNNPLDAMQIKGPDYQYFHDLQRKLLEDRLNPDASMDETLSDIKLEIKELKDRENMLMWVLHCETDQERIQELNADLAQNEAQIKQLSDAYYEADRQRDAARMSIDLDSAKTYGRAKELESDMQKITDVISFYNSGVGDPNTIQNQTMPYLAQKYGLNEAAFYEAAHGTAPDIGTLDAAGNYKNAYGQHFALQQEFEACKQALDQRDYSYDMMTGYEKYVEDRRWMAEQNAEAAAFAKEHPGWATLASVFVTPFQGVDVGTTLIGSIGHNNMNDLESYVPMTTDTMPITNFVHTVRDTVMDEHIDSKFGQGVYTVGTGFADGALMTGVSALPGGAVLAPLAETGRSAADQMKSSIEAGSSNRSVLWSSLGAAGLELGLEVLPADDVLSTSLFRDVTEILGIQSDDIARSTKLLEDALELPADTGAHKLAAELSDKLDDALTEAGMDASDLYHMTRDDQAALIKKVTEDALPQKELDNLTELMKEEGLTIPTGHGKVEVQGQLGERYANSLPEGHITEESIRKYAKDLETADIDSMCQYLQDMGYDANITASVKDASRAKIIRITNGTATKNISQVQFSPGGGRHGPNPYLKLSTTDQGIIKIVFGDPSTYRSTGNERMTIIFAEEVK